MSSKLTDAVEQDDKTSKIRDLNDALRRRDVQHGMIVMTSGISAKGDAFVAKAMRGVAEFDAFDADCDPYGEHDFGALTIQGEKIFFKLDYYDLSMTAGSPDPADPSVTKRILTVMLASDY